MPARRGKEGGGGGLASKLFNNFDSDRKYDPFLDTDPVIQDSKEGMVSALNTIFVTRSIYMVPACRIQNNSEGSGEHRAERLMNLKSAATAAN